MISLRESVLVNTSFSHLEQKKSHAFRVALSAHTNMYTEGGLLYYVGLIYLG